MRVFISELNCGDLFCGSGIVYRGIVACNILCLVRAGGSGAGRLAGCGGSGQERGGVLAWGGDRLEVGVVGCCHRGRNLAGWWIGAVCEGFVGGWKWGSVTRNGKSCQWGDKAKNQRFSRSEAVSLYIYIYYL